MIEIKHLTTGYGRHIVSRNINERLERGELVCLLGANGIGKSTLLRTLCGFLPPLEGEIIIEGKNMKDTSPHKIGRRVGVVLTERIDVRQMKVKDIVAMGRNPYTGFWGSLNKEDLQQVEQAMQQAGIDALKERFGEGIKIIKPSEMAETIKQLSLQDKDGTYLENQRPDVRTIYFQDGEFKTSATMTGDNLPSQKVREESRKEFLEIHDYAQQVKKELQQACGYNGDGSIHFANAYYPEIFSERVEIWKGDIFAGSVGIDPSCGLIRINQGGDFGPMEWFGERTDSVFNSVSLDAIKESIGRYCLDEGIGICDANRTLNLETANKDVAMSKDSKLIEAIDNCPSRQASIKR